MIIIMKHGASPNEIDSVLERLSREEFKVHLSQGVERTIIGLVGDNTKEKLPGLALEAMPGVDRVVPVVKPYKLAGRDFHPENSTIKIGSLTVGGDEVQIIAGPCAVEEESQMLEIAQSVKEAGATMLRGGAFKPRTSPYSFQGLEEKGLKILAKAREKTGLPVVTEVMDVRTLPLVAEYADVLQIGARNMQNFFLLREIGKVDKPVLLKRGASATLEEWILAAEYIMGEGNHKVILCERGIRTFENFTRNTLDLSAIPALKELSHLPVFVDPSHGTGRWNLVTPMSKAAIAAGADGLMVEVHSNPSEAKSDGPQSLNPENFAKMVNEIKQITTLISKKTVGIAGD